MTTMVARLGSMWSRMTASGEGLWSRFKPSWLPESTGSRQEGLDLAAHRRLAHQLHRNLSADGVPRSVLLSTPRENHISAVAGIHLACVVAEELHASVLLIDASDEGEVGQLLGSGTTRGLTDLLTDPAGRLEEAVLSSSRPDVAFLPRGPGAGSATGLSPDHPGQLLSRISEHWDFVIVAAGGVLNNPLALAMAPYVGQVLLLVTEHETQVEDIDEARMTLDFCKARDVSLVVNLASNRSS